MSSAKSKPDLGVVAGQAAVDVLQVLLPWPAAMVGPDADGVSVPDRITSTVPLAGQGLSGEVRLHLPRAFLAEASRALVDADGVLHDVAGELANMVAGRVASLLAVHGLSCTLGTPSVVAEASPPAPSSPGGERGGAEVRCGGHRLCVLLQCRRLAT